MIELIGVVVFVFMCCWLYFCCNEFVENCLYD